MQNLGEIVLVITSLPEDVSENMVKSLIESGLVACVSLMPVRSCFLWKGDICREREDLLIIKTQKSLSLLVQEKIASLHPYSIPEILVIPILSGHLPYIEWVESVTRPSQG